MARVPMTSSPALTSACRRSWWASSGSATVTTHHVATPRSSHSPCPGTCQSVHTPCQGACPDSLTPCAGGSACVDTATDLQYYDCAGDCLHVFQPCNGAWSRGVAITCTGVTRRLDYPFLLQAAATSPRGRAGASVWTWPTPPWPRAETRVRAWRCRVETPAPRWSEGRSDYFRLLHMTMSRATFSATARVKWTRATRGCVTTPASPPGSCAATRVPLAP